MTNMTTNENQPTEQEISAARVNDALRWVAQEARAVVLLGYVGPNHEKLRAALKALDAAYAKADASR